VKTIKSTDGDYYEIECERIAATDRAVLIELDGWQRWLPLSRIEITEDYGDELVIVLPEWLAKAKGINR
jgi:hypothetical protein